MASCGDSADSEQAEAETTQEAPEEENIVNLTETQYKAIGITLGSVEERALSGMLKVNGFIDVPPQNLVSVTTQMGGIIKSTPLQQGSVVKKGQVIAVLENQEFVQMQQEYLENQSQLQLAEAEYQRQQELARQQVNSQKVLQQARAQYQLTSARANALKARLQLININAQALTPGNIRSQISIYSPINGYVTKVNVNIGKFVNPNDVMFELVNSSTLHVELNVFEKDAVKIKRGQKVRFTMANDTTERLAEVQLVGKDINPDKTVTVHSIANGLSGGFIPGTYLKALIETTSEVVPALPEAAVVDYIGKKYIFIAQENDSENQVQTSSAGVKEEPKDKSYRFEMVEVSVGNANGGYVAVTLPGSPNTNFQNNIVLKGSYDLLSTLKNSEEEE